MKTHQERMRGGIRWWILREEYQENCDKHFSTEQEAQEYVLKNERGFENSDTRYRYEIVKL